MGKDYYSILGIDKNSSTEDIKKVFRKLAHKYHPDKAGGDEAKFKEISEAYSVLSDNKKRAEYDAYGRVFNESAQGGASGFGNFDFSNFASQGGFSTGGGAAFGGQEFDLGDIFGDIFGGSRERVQRGRDISIDLELSFRESIFGVERKVLLTKTSACKSCRGTGAKVGTELKMCAPCNGKGKVHEAKRSMLGTFTSVRVCNDCHGSGKIPKEKCKQCHGKGVKREQEEVIIAVPAGIENGEMIRLSGMGEALQGGVPGDLYVKIHAQPDSVFTKEGANLVMKLNLKLSDAILGGKYTISTLDGNIVVTVPPGVSYGEILRVRGKGVPFEKDKRGDLLIKLTITLPNKLSRKAKQLIEELKNEGI